MLAKGPTSGKSDVRHVCKLQNGQAKLSRHVVPGSLTFGPVGPIRHCGVLEELQFKQTIRAPLSRFLILRLFADVERTVVEAFGDVAFCFGLTDRRAVGILTGAVTRSAGSLAERDMPGPDISTIVASTSEAAVME